MNMAMFCISPECDILVDLDLPLDEQISGPILDEVVAMCDETNTNYTLKRDYE